MIFFKTLSYSTYLYTSASFKTLRRQNDKQTQPCAHSQPQSAHTADCDHTMHTAGVCLVAFPKGRCLCKKGFSGHDCAQQTCINNCSFPNGDCTNGECVCNKINNPYNNTQSPYAQFDGPDCSFITPYAASNSLGVSSCFVLAILGLYFLQNQLDY